jgi:hypothetical protein
MKETNLETQLRSLEPRRPSAKLKRRIFPARAVGHEFSRMIRWFAPVAACGLLAVVVFHQEGGFQGVTSEVHSVGLIASNQAAVIYEPEVNRLPAIFEWTNRNGSALSIGSFLPGKAN